MQHEIDQLKKRVEHLNEEVFKWYTFYKDTYMKLNEARISKAFSEFQLLEEYREGNRLNQDAEAKLESRIEKRKH